MANEKNGKNKRNKTKANKKTKTIASKRARGCIVKRKGHEETFDERKIYASCYSACLGAKIHPTEAEEICEKVANEIRSWIHGKGCIESSQIFKKAVNAMKKHHKEAAYMYETHRDVN